MAWLDDEFGEGERSVASLKRVARHQRALIAVVLAQLALWAGYLGLTVLSRGRNPGVEFAVLLTFVLGAAGAVYVFRLSWELRGGFAAVVFALATVPPCMGLIVLTLVNSYASAELKRHGIKVGVFGASERDVLARPSLYDDEDAGW